MERERDTIDYGGGKSHAKSMIEHFRDAYTSIWCCLGKQHPTYFDSVLFCTEVNMLNQLPVAIRNTISSTFNVTNNLF